ncbi:MAG: MlaD family protein [Candidatus Methylacidiphilaceae bacterium]
MSRKTKDVKIGLFVIAAAALLVGGLLAFGLRDAFRPHYDFETYYSGEVNGLSVGSPVLLHGVPVGKVTQVSFTWVAYPQYHSHYVLVAAEVDQRLIGNRKPEEEEKLLQVEIDRGLRARVQPQGITGTSVLALEYVDPKRHPPISIPWHPKHYYIPSAPGQFHDIVQEVETLLQKLGAVDFPGLGASANGLLGELRHTNGQIKILLAQTSTALASGNLPELLESTDRTLTQLRETTISLNEVIGDLQRYPAGFLFGQPPPRPGSLQGSKR